MIEEFLFPVILRLNQYFNFLKKIKKTNPNEYNLILWISLFHRKRYHKFKAFVNQGMAIKFALEKSEDSVDNDKK